MERIKTYLKGLLYTLYVYTIGISKKKNRELIALFVKEYDNGNKVKQVVPTLTQIGFDEYIFNKNLQIVEENFAMGNVSFFELNILSLFAKIYHPKKIFEIGTFDGRTTLNMSLNSDEDTLIYTLDLPQEKIGATQLEVDQNDIKYIDKTESGMRFKNKEAGKKITQLFGDSASFDYSPYNGTIDMVFVDGSHAYDYVVNDTEVALKLLSNKGGGLIVWHDYDSWDGVTKFLNELSQTDPRFKNIRWIKGATIAFIELNR